MTISFRNSVITIGIVLSLLFVVISLFFFYLLFTREADITAILTPEVMANSITIGALVLFALVFGIILRISFSKTLSAEIFFFSIFILTLSFESLRIIIFFLTLRHLPFLYGIIATRVVIFARFIRAYSLFGAGLFAYGTRNPKTGLFLGLGALASFAFAAIVPVDVTRQSFDLLYTTGIESVINIILLFTYIITIFTFVLAGYTKKTQEYIQMALGLFLAVIGSQVIIFLPDLIFISAPGLVILIIGSILFSKKTHDLYLWG